jgi:short subunit dehydrogenase-like uncharacterized protein
MTARFLLYGSTGFVGGTIARLATVQGLRPVLAARNAEGVRALAAELGLEHRAFDLEDPSAIDGGLDGMTAVLHCAGPFINTSAPMVEACLRKGTHYMDLTGEIPVCEALAARDAEARAKGIMILPGVGFDVVPTDCLAAHLKRRLPSATRLSLAFSVKGPAGLPPGTVKTGVEMVRYGILVRRDGKLVRAPREGRSREIDFGEGPLKASLMTWGDLCMAFYSTGIPTIEDFVGIRGTGVYGSAVRLLRPLFESAAVRGFVKGILEKWLRGPTAEERGMTSTSVWGEVEDACGQKAVSRLHGPEPGVTWTSRAALAVVRKVLEGRAPPGFQTPSLAFGADFALECEGVTREDVGG